MGLVSVLGLGIGAVVRSAAGGIAIVVGLLMVLPTVIAVLQTWIEWVGDVLPYLMSEAGQRMTVLQGNDLMPVGVDQLTPGVATLVVAAWAAVALVLGAISLTRRDA
jgi:ABC-2 type transport system permease protein